MGGVGKCGITEDDADVGCEEAGTEPMIMGMQTEGGREEMKEVDCAAATDAVEGDSLVEGITDNGGGCG